MNFEEEDLTPNINFDSEPQALDIPEPSETLLQKIENACESIRDDPPGLIRLVGENKTLQIIAKALQELFIAQGYVKYNYDQRKIVDRGVRVLVSELCRMASEKDGDNLQDLTRQNNENIINQLQMRLAETQGMMNDIARKAEEAENQRDELQAELETMKNENDQFFQERTEFLKRMNTIKSQNDEEIARIQDEADEKEEQLRELKDKMKMNEITYKRIDEQLEKANEDNSALNTEIMMLKNKLASKVEKLEAAKEKIDELTIENRRLDYKNQELSTNNNRLSQQLKESELALSSLNKETLNQLEEENQKMRQSIAHLSQICSTQSEDLMALQHLQSQSTDLLRHQLELVSQYDAELSTCHAEKEDLQAQSDGDAKLITALREQLDKARDNAETSGNYASPKELEEIKELLRPRFGEGNSAEFIKQLLENETNEDLRQQNVRQTELIENILKFITRIVTTGEIKDLLSEGSPEIRLADDESFKDHLLIEIARCRHIAMQNSSNDIDMPTPETVQGIINSLAESDKSENRELFNILASQTLASETLRKLYEKSNEKVNKILDELKTVQDVVNYDGSQDELPSIIVEKLKNFRAFTVKISELVDDDYDPNNFDSVLEYLKAYVKNSAIVLHQVDTNLRQAIEYNGDINDIPLQACDVINSLQAQVNDIKEQYGEMAEDNSAVDASHSRERLVDISGHFHNELNKRSKQISDLEGSVNTKEAQIQSLNGELERMKQEYAAMEKLRNDAIQHANDLENKYSKFAENYEDIEQNIEKLREENKKLRATIDEKTKKYDERLDKLIAQERQQHADDIKRAEDRQRKREEQFKKEIESKDQKIRNLKESARKKLAKYEEAFNKQKETTKAIRQQNEILAAKLEKHTGPVISAKEVERLRTEVESLEAEKQMLTIKLKQTSEMVEKVRIGRDQYWEAQMSMREAEILKSASENASQANDHYDQFLDQLVGILEPYMPNEFQVINEEAIMSTINTLIERMEIAENDTYDRQQQSSQMLSTIRPPISQENHEAELAHAKTLAALQEWDRWGRDLFVNVTDGQVPSQSCKELRYMLGEMILASIGHRKLVYRLESLRSQKQLLLRMCDMPQRRDSYPTFRVSLIYVIGALRILRKTGHFPTSYMQQVVTPTKQSNVSLF